MCLWADRAAASAGQSGLMALYDTLFAMMDLQASQLLVTPRDFRDENFKVNLRETTEELLSVSRVIPVFNENDAISDRSLDKVTIASALTCAVSYDHATLLYLREQPVQLSCASFPSSVIVTPSRAAASTRSPACLHCSNSSYPAMPMCLTIAVHALLRHAGFHDQVVLYLTSTRSSVERHIRQDQHAV